MESPPKQGGKTSRALGFIIRLAIGAGCIAALFHFDLINLGVLVEAMKSPGYLAVAYLCLLVTAPLSAIRWLYLLRALGFRPTVWWTINITFISLFCNTFLPGSHGGDLVRIGMAYRASGGKLNRITLSVIVDRLSGIVALLALGAAMLAWLPVQYREWVIGIACILTAGLIGGVAVALRWGLSIAALLAKFPKPVGPVLAYICTEVVLALQQYVSKVEVLIGAFLISVLQYMIIIGSLIVIGWSMKFTSLPIYGYGISGVWAMVANALPLSPGGLGVGEAAFAQAASLLDTARSGARYATVFLVMRVLTIVVGLVGVIPFMMYRSDVRSGMRMSAAEALEDEPAREMVKRYSETA